MAIEGLTRPGGLQAQHPARRQGTGFIPVDVQEDLTLQHVKGLVDVRMAMQRRHFSRIEIILEHEKCAARFFRRRLPGVQATPQNQRRSPSPFERTMTSVVLTTPPQMFMGLESHKETLGVAVNAFTDLIIDTETQQRTMLLLSLEPRSTNDLPPAAGTCHRLVRRCARATPGPAGRSGPAPTCGGDPQRCRHRVAGLAHRCGRAITSGSRTRHAVVGASSTARSHEQRPAHDVNP